MATTIVTLTGDEASLLRAFQKIQAAQEKTDQGFKKTKDTANNAANQIGRDMIAAGDATNKAFNDSLRELKRMGPEGKAAAEQIERHLRESGRAGRQSFEQVLTTLGKLDDEAAKVGRNAARELKSAGKSGEQAFGDGAAQKVKEFATAWLSVGAALGVVQSGMADVRAEQEAALGSLLGQADPERRLAQVATSGADLDALIAKGETISATTGMPRNDSKMLVFTARSEGFEADLDMIAANHSVLEGTSQAKLIGTLGKAFKSEGLSGEQRMSALLTAAGLSKFDAETVGKALEKSAVASTDAGADMAETMAVNAVMANVLGDPAGDRSNAFASFVNLNDKLKGKGFVGAVKTIRAMSDDERKKTLGGSMEVNQAFSVLDRNLAEVEQVTDAVRRDEIETAAGRGTLRQRRSVVESSPRFQARIAVLASANRKEIADEQALAAEEARFQSQQALARARATEQGGSQLMGAFGSAAGSTARNLGLGADQSAGIVSGVAGDEMSRLQRVASKLAGDTESFQVADRRTLEAIALAARLNADGKLNETAVAGFLGAMTGEPIAAGDITTQQVTAVRGVVGSLASSIGRRDEFGANYATSRQATAERLLTVMESMLSVMQGVQQNTSQAPVISGTALQSPVAAAAAP